MKNELLKKRENEIENEYIARIYRNRVEYGLNNSMCRDIINKELGYEKAESTYRGIAKIWNECSEYMIDKQSNSSELEELEAKRKEDIKDKIDELKYEQRKIRAEKSELNRLLNKHSKFELFYDNLKESIETLPIPKLEEIDCIKNIDEGWILTITDIHYNADFVSENNVYNREECKRRFEILLSKTKELIKRNNITKLTILSMGDEIQNILRISDFKLNDISVVDSVVEISRLIATFLNELSKYVNITYRHNIYANHSQTRPLGSKANSIPSEDLSKIIGNYIKDMLTLNDRIEVVLSEKEYAMFEMVGQTIMFMHGHNIKNIKNTIKDFSILTRKFIDICFLGHYHAGMSFNIGELNGNTQIVVSPSFIGSDPYSDSLLVGSKGMCELHKIEPWCGITETYKIILN